MPKTSFSEAYLATYDDLWLYCLCRSSTPADAEDILADTFTQAYAKFDQAPAGENLRPWLYGIARNNLRNQWRKSSRRGRIHLRLVADASRNGGADERPGPETLALDETDQLAALFTQLSPTDQEVLALATWEDLDHQQIAIVLDCTEGTARSRLHRARKRFAKKITEENLDDPATLNRPATR